MPLATPSRPATGAHVARGPQGPTTSFAEHHRRARVLRIPLHHLWSCPDRRGEVQGLRRTPSLETRSHVAGVSVPGLRRVRVPGDAEQTLIKGWWGVASFIANVFVVAGNWSQKQYHKTQAPRAHPRGLTTPRSTPLPSGRPLRQRLGPWIALVVLTLVAFAVGASTSSTSASGADAISEQACASWDMLKLDTAQQVSTSAEFDSSFYLLGGAGDTEVRQAKWRLPCGQTAERPNVRCVLLARLDSACQGLGAP